MRDEHGDIGISVRLLRFPELLISGFAIHAALAGGVGAATGAIVGESFSEIFQGNAAIIGMPCFAASRDDVDRLQTLMAKTPDVVIAADVASGVITAGALRMTATLPPALRDGFLSGQWNPTLMLLDHFEEVRAVAARLPYIRGF